MSLRAVILGLLLGTGIAATTYFNDLVIKQTPLIGNMFPISVFGVVVILLFILNPLLRGLGPHWPLRPGEIAILTAMGLAVCGWPGSSFFRSFVTTLAMPSHLVKTNTSWQAAGVMSYVPGGSPRLAEGYIHDWSGLATALVDAGNGKGSTGTRLIWDQLDPSVQEMVRNVMRFDMATARPREDGTSVVLDPGTRRSLLAALNSIISSSEVRDPAVFSSLPIHPDAASLIRRLDEPDVLSQRDTERLNRYLIDAALHEFITPAPQGKGVLLADGEYHPAAVETLVQGTDDPEPVGLSELPWSIWWPTLRLWGGVALLLAFAALCLAIIVHPQWSRRELLAYPIVQFVHESTVPAPGGRFPLVAQSRLFWLSLLLVLAYHGLNIAHTWFPGAIGGIPNRINFMPFQVFFPNASRSPLSFIIFEPFVFPSVVAFAFLLRTEISLSYGLAPYLWLAFGAIMIGHGIPLGAGMTSTHIAPMFRFGAFLGTGVMLAYVGRRYYANVITSMVGLSRAPGTPVYAVWAARLLLLCLVGTIASLNHFGGLDWTLATLLVSLIILYFVIIARVNAETGVFFMGHEWMPIGVLMAVFGYQGLGPHAFVVIGLACFILLVSPRSALMPYLTNGLRMTDQISDTGVRRTTPLITMMILLGFSVALCVTLLIQYNIGAPQDGWSSQVVPSETFNQLAVLLSELSARGELSEATARHGWGHWTNMTPEGGALLWVAIGVVAVLACAFARLHLSSWPFHPIMFLVMGTYAGIIMGFSFLLGWAMKAATAGLGGARSYQNVKPLMIGVIAGELLAAVFNLLLGTVYYRVTDLTPPFYQILPS